MTTVTSTPPAELIERRTRSWALDALVVAAPLLELTSELIAPREPESMSPAAEVAFLRDHATRLTVSWVVGILAAAAIGAAYVILAGRLRARGRVVGRVAATLGVLGGAGLAAHMAVSLAGLDLALWDPTSGEAIETIDNGRAALVTIPLVVLGLNLAVVLISVA